MMVDMLKKLLAHCAIVISGMYLVFFFIDRVNPAMAFINNNITKVLLFILALLAIFNAIQVIALERRRLKWKLRKNSQTSRTNVK